ncbi:MAG: hypothetical protein KIT57_03450 [Blastocatellales bacterium]|nr:hypothetical protein [Blastocatellales bacterium]
MKNIFHLRWKWWEAGFVLCAGIAPALLLSSLLREYGGASATPPNTQNWQPPSFEVQQLFPIRGIVPVEIIRAKSHFTAPNLMDDTTFVIKNNSDSDISAISLQIGITAEVGGTRSVKYKFLAADYFIHPDVKAANVINPFKPGDTKVLEGTTVSYPIGTFLTRITVKIGYVEFSDGDTLGSQNEGGGVISEIRTGAMNYKAWLKDKYDHSNRSENVLVVTLESTEEPEDLIIETGYERHGARAYHKYMRDLLKSNGLGEILRRFKNGNE